jgi:hypothetical protein
VQQQDVLVVAAVGYEHNVVRAQGELRTYTLRVTHVYRREDGE